MGFLRECRVYGYIGKKLYIPLDPDPDRPNVESQLQDESSLLKEIKTLIRIRQSHKALMNRGDIRFVCNGAKGNPLIYYRSSGEENILVVINPTDMPYDLKTDLNMQEMIYSIGDKPDLQEGRCIIKERSASLWVVK